MFPGNKKDLHGTPWLAKPRKPVSPINAAVALEVNAKCYNYKTEANESVSTIVEWFDLDYRLFIQRNRKQFGNLQDVTYRLGQTKKARQLQNILDVVSNVTADLTTEKPYFTCTFYDKGGAASNVTCLSGNTQKCAQNGTVNCALRYKDVNVSLELAAGECLEHQHPSSLAVHFMCRLFMDAVGVALTQWQSALPSCCKLIFARTAN